MNVVERACVGWSYGGGFSSGIKGGPLLGVLGSSSYTHRNLFGKNQKLHLSLEGGLVNTLYRANYTIPWIEGCDKRTKSSITIQKSSNPCNLVQRDISSLSIGRVTSGIEFSRVFSPKLTATTGLTFQRVDVRDGKGNLISKDVYHSPLSASGNTHDQMLLAKGGCVYNTQSSTFMVSMEQGLPILGEWLSFNRVNAHAKTLLKLGPPNLHFSLRGGNVRGNFPPHEAFVIGGTNSVRGYDEGNVGSGRSYAVGKGEISFPLIREISFPLIPYTNIGAVDGVLFADYGGVIGSGSGPSIHGNLTGATQKPGSGYGHGAGFRIKSQWGVLRFECAFNHNGARKFHFAIGDDPN